MKSKALALALSTFLMLTVSAAAQTTTEGARIFSATNSWQTVGVKQWGTGAAVSATAYSSQGVGVLGAACNPNSLTACNGVGLWGVVQGLNQGPNSTAGRFEIKGSDGGQNLLLGVFDGATKFRVDNLGNVYTDGCYCVGGADFAESFAVKGAKKEYAPGDVLIVDASTNRQVALAHESYSTLVAGIYSTKPGVLGAPQELQGKMPQTGIPMAVVVGVVPTKVSAENGAIRRGDLLVTSSTPGYAMKGTDRSRMIGAVVEKALEPLPSGKGTIQVLVTLQ
jgi:hypothetical protein